MKRTIAASSVVIDYAVYPRHEINSSQVGDIVRAIEAGDDMPPIVVEQGSLRLVDGAHRLTAWIRAHGESAMIPAELKEYDGDAALFVDAVRRNARHGVRLTKWDQARAIQIADALKIEPAELASALAITVDVMGELKARKTAQGPDGKPISIKRTARHLAGTKLSQKQVEAQDKASGWTVRYHADQIVNALDGDLFDWNNAAEVQALRRLKAILDNAPLGDLEPIAP